MRYIGSRWRSWRRGSGWPGWMTRRSTGSTAAGIGCVPGRTASAGLTRLKRRFIISPLSNGNVALLTNMAKAAGLPWDLVLCAEVFRHYKPDPDVYLGAAALLGLAPEQVMLCAAHNSDLAGARSCGLRTAFIARPTEYGPHQTRDFGPDSDWDYAVDTITALADRLGA